MHLSVYQYSQQESKADVQTWEKNFNSLRTQDTGQSAKHTCTHKQYTHTNTHYFNLKISTKNMWLQELRSHISDAVPVSSVKE